MGGGQVTNLFHDGHVLDRTRIRAQSWKEHIRRIAACGRLPSRRHVESVVRSNQLGCGEGKLLEVDWLVAETVADAGAVAGVDADMDTGASVGAGAATDAGAGTDAATGAGAGAADQERRAATHSSVNRPFFSNTI